MAESVRVMGSLDGWSRGEEMSPEYSGDYARFSATLKLRPGRDEIKFLVDGEWRLSPALPTASEGVMENNLLIVDQLQLDVFLYLERAKFQENNLFSGFL